MKGLWGSSRDRTDEQENISVKGTIFTPPIFSVKEKNRDIQVGLGLHHVYLWGHLSAILCFPLRPTLLTSAESPMLMTAQWYHSDASDAPWCMQRCYQQHHMQTPSASSNLLCTRDTACPLLWFMDIKIRSSGNR